MNSAANPNNVQVNDECTKGATGQVVYGVVKIQGDIALCIKTGMTRQRTARTIVRIPLAELTPIR